MKPPLPKPAQKPRSAPTKRLKPKTISQQGTDFTAEGAPPPGKVGAHEPVDAGEKAQVEYEAARHDQAKRS